MLVDAAGKASVVADNLSFPNGMVRIAPGKHLYPDAQSRVGFAGCDDFVVALQEFHPATDEGCIVGQQPRRDGKWICSEGFVRIQPGSPI